MTEESEVSGEEKPMTFDDFLRFDPLDIAQKMTGKEYGKDKATASLGHLLHSLYSEAKREQLALRNDSYYAIPFVDYVAIVEDLGFELCFEEQFSPDDEGRGGGDVRVDVFRIYWRAGLLLTCESHGARALNSSTIYLNVEFPDTAKPWGISGLSGYLNREMFDEGRRVWIGNFDGREGLRHTLVKIEDAGTILPKWIETTVFLTTQLR